jgi:hypothetical protein
VGTFVFQKIVALLVETVTWIFEITGSVTEGVVSGGTGQGRCQ